MTLRYDTLSTRDSPPKRIEIVLRVRSNRWFGVLTARLRRARIAEVHTLEPSAFIFNVVIPLLVIAFAWAAVLARDPWVHKILRLEV